MKQKIYIPQPIVAAGEDYLIEKGYEIVLGSGKTESIKNDIAVCDAMIQRTAKVDKEILEAGKNLKIIARHGAGYDNLDWKAANESGIHTTYSPDTTTLSVAEFTITVILNLAKRLKESEELVRNGDFQKKFSLKGTDVAGKTLGIIGLGKIGKEVARKAALGLDMRVISYVPHPEGKEIPEYVEIVSWEELLQTSDYISLHVPGGEKNQGIISKKEFAMMKKSASLIQVSRGGVVDEEALAEAIRNSQIRGAAVDVFSEEPPQKDNPLLKLEQVILTPHIGSNTVECMDRIALDVAEDVHLVLSGENPKHPIKR
jgi:D-3-phosphoglycerate dehydrogenase